MQKGLQRGHARWYFLLPLALCLWQAHVLTGVLKKKIHDVKLHSQVVKSLDKWIFLEGSRKNRMCTQCLEKCLSTNGLMGTISILKPLLGQNALP